MPDMDDSERPTDAELTVRMGLCSPVSRVCDFCSFLDDATPATWFYPAVAVSIDVGGFLVELDLGAVSDDWAACDTCAAFIEAGDYSGLAQHIGYPEGPLPAAMAQFRDTRVGPGQRL